LEAELPVKEIMTPDVVTVDLGSSCVDAAERMLEHGIGGIIVTDDGRPVGILTERDLVDKVILRDLQASSVNVEDVMTSPLITVHSTELVNDVMRKMARLRIHRFPVVEEKRLVGIVTDTDLLVVSAQMGEIFAELIEMSAERFPPVSAREWEETGEEKDLVTHARQIMRDYGYQMLPVVDKNNHLSGVVTDKDMMRVTSTRSNVTVDGFVNEVAFVTPVDDLRSVLYRMAELRLRYLPVVRGVNDAVVIGVIGLSSIFDALKERAPDQRVSDIMATDIKTCQRSDTLNGVWSDLLDFGISGMPVMDGQEVVGVITVHDILKSGHARLDRESRHTRQVRVEKIMNTPLYTISRDETAKTAIERLLNLGVGRIYVVDGGGLSGVVDLYDLARSMIA